MKSIIFLLFVSIQSFAQVQDISKCSIGFYSTVASVTSVKEAETGIKVNCSGDVTLVPSQNQSQDYLGQLLNLLTHMNLEASPKSCNESIVEFSLNQKKYVSWHDCLYSTPSK